MARQVENLNITFPDGLPVEYLMHWHALAVNRRAVVQVLNREL